MEGSKLITVDNVVFEGGGSLGCAYVGAWREFSKHVKTRLIRRFAGSSVGALFATFLACGADAEYLNKHLSVIDGDRFIESTPWYRGGIIANIIRFMTRYGYSNGHYLEEWIGARLDELISREVTFQELFELRGVELYITGTNLNSGRGEVFCFDTYPTMKVRDALRISGSFPGIFTAPRFDGALWTDGGLLNNYPIEFFDEKGGATVGFKLISDGEPPGAPIYNEVKNVVGFIRALTLMLIWQAGNSHVSEENWKKTIKIAVGDKSALNFDISPETIQWLIERGEEGVRKYFA